MSAPPPRPDPMMPPRDIPLGEGPLCLEDALRIVHGEARVTLTSDETVRERWSQGAQRLKASLDDGGTVYGVTTGFGDSCETAVEGDLVAQLPVNLIRFHGCGTGPLLSSLESAAVMVTRLASLTAGWSAVRPILLENLVQLINSKVRPVIPARGSVGASGDLTPLSYLAALLMGEREAYVGERVVDAAEGLRLAELAPLELQPKESLALMNGTSVMTGLCLLAYERVLGLSRWAATLTAMTSDGTHGEPRHFDERLFLAKPHPGQALAARWIREDIEYDPVASRRPTRVQDRYSIRCAPHVIGVLLDTLPWAKRWIETELNGAGDNPLVDPETGDILHGGNFYGGHMAQVADTLKTCVANVADLLDRQLLLLCHPNTNHGLPANLVGASSGQAPAHHGFKAMQIATSAITAEALKLTMPASVFSRSCENHNQDKVSMGTIAARDCLQVLDLAETVAAIHTLGCAQAVELRGIDACHRRSRDMLAQVRELVPFVDADRRMDTDIETILSAYRSGKLDVGRGDGLGELLDA